MSEAQISNNTCPKCSHYCLWQSCPAIGCNDGWIDMHEYDDPMLFDPGEEERCDECSGKGSIEWCPECGYDFKDSDICAICGGTGWIQEGWGEYHMDGIPCLACAEKEEE